LKGAQDAQQALSQRLAAAEKERDETRTQLATAKKERDVANQRADDARRDANAAQDARRTLSGQLAAAEKERIEMATQLAFASLPVKAPPAKDTNRALPRNPSECALDTFNFPYGWWFTGQCGDVTSTLTPDPPPRLLWGREVPFDTLRSKWSFEA